MSASTVEILTLAVALAHEARELRAEAFYRLPVEEQLTWLARAESLVERHRPTTHEHQAEVRAADFEADGERLADDVGGPDVEE